MADWFARDKAAASFFSNFVDDAAMLNGTSGAAFLAELAEGRDGFANTTLTAGLAGKRVLLLSGEQDALFAADTYHTPLVETYEAVGGVNLTHAIIPGDHSFSAYRIGLKRHVMRWILAD